MPAQLGAAPPRPQSGTPDDPATIRDALREAGVPALGGVSPPRDGLPARPRPPWSAGMLGCHDTTTARTAAEAGSPWTTRRTRARTQGHENHSTPSRASAMIDVMFRYAFPSAASAAADALKAAAIVVAAVDGTRS